MTAAELDPVNINRPIFPAHRSGIAYMAGVEYGSHRGEAIFLITWVLAVQRQWKLFKYDPA